MANERLEAAKLSEKKETLRRVWPEPHPSWNEGSMQVDEEKEVDGNKNAEEDEVTENKNREETD